MSVAEIRSKAERHFRALIKTLKVFKKMFKVVSRNFEWNF